MERGNLLYLCDASPNTCFPLLIPSHMLHRGITGQKADLESKWSGIDSDHYVQIYVISSVTASRFRMRVNHREHFGTHSRKVILSRRLIYRLHFCLQCFLNLPSHLRQIYKWCCRFACNMHMWTRQVVTHHDVITTYFGTNLVSHGIPNPVFQSLCSVFVLLF